MAILHWIVQTSTVHKNYRTVSQINLICFNVGPTAVLHSVSRHGGVTWTPVKSVISLLFRSKLDFSRIFDSLSNALWWCSRGGSDTTPPKVNRFGWNLEHSEYIFADFRAQNRYFEPRRSLMRGKPGNLKQYGQSVAVWGRPYQTWCGSPSHLWAWLSPWCGDDSLFDSRRVGFRCQAIQWRHSRDRGSKGCCHGNKFWDENCYWKLALCERYYDSD